MFTLEVVRKAIAVTDANEEDARELFESDAFKADLMEVESDGAPIWDGFATLSIRPATRAEIAEFESTPIGEGDEVDETVPMIMFLVDIDEPGEAEFGAMGMGFSSGAALTLKTGRRRPSLVQTADTAERLFPTLNPTGTGAAP